MIDLSKLVTEARNPRTMCLDEMTPLEIITEMNEEDARVAGAVKKALPQIAEVITWCRNSLEDDGRLIYMGAGTSGRLGVLDAVECIPTFGVDEGKVIGLIAGGERAFVKAVEGAEDSRSLGEADLRRLCLTSRDVVVGIAASGRTPYAIGGVCYARRMGCKTAAMVCNKNSELAAAADVAIELIVGPEVLTGSTRLKAGTAEKMACNMISTATMFGTGKVYQNLMVDVVQTNAKLVRRAENIVVEVTGCKRDEARTVLLQAEGNAKTAIVMILSACDAHRARERLKKAKGRVRHALEPS